MHITCSICAELFNNADVDQISMTPCGHIFHGPCLMQWIERSKTCPQCRHKTTYSSIIRTFFNVSSTNDTTSTESSIEQQSKIDNLRYQLLEKTSELKAKDEEIGKLNGDVAKMKKTQRLSRETIMGLEQKIEQNAILTSTYFVQIKHLKDRVKEMDALQAELTEAKQQLTMMENMRQILVGSQKEAEEFLNANMSSKALAVTAVALKRELRINEEKRHALRVKQRQLHDEIQRLLADKTKIEEENAVLESKLYKFENAEKENHHTSTDSIVLSPMPSTVTASLKPSTSSTSPSTPTAVVAPAADTRATKIIKLNKAEAHSPFVKSSSIAGLAPLIKRPSGLSLQMKNVSGLAHNHEFSIFKKPRMASHKWSSLK